MDNVPLEFPRLFLQTFEDIKQNVCREIDLKAKELFNLFLMDFNTSCVNLGARTADPVNMAMIDSNSQSMINPIDSNISPMVELSAPKNYELIQMSKLNGGSFENQLQSSHAYVNNLLPVAQSQTLTNVQEIVTTGAAENNCGNILESHKSNLDQRPPSYHKSNTMLSGSIFDVWNYASYSVNDQNKSLTIDQNIFKIEALNCPICGFLLNSKNEYFEHLKYHHKVHANLCLVTDCPMSFAQPSQLLAHIRINHSQITEWKCTICKIIFAHQADYNIEQNYLQLHAHMLNHHFKGQFRCTLPGCLYFSDSRLCMIEHNYRSHREQSHHSNTLNGNQTISNIAPNDSAQLVGQSSSADGQHNQSHNLNDNSQVITLVENISEQNENVLQPQYSGELPFRCFEEGCGKSFAHVHQLTFHQKVHTKPKKKLKPKKVATNQTSLLVQSTSSMNNELLQNGDNSKKIAAVQPQDANSDAIPKTKIKIVYLFCHVKKCPQNKQLCLDEDGLKEHLRLSHNLLPYPCLATNCGQSFEHLNELDDHIQSVHSKVTQWNCSECNQVLPDCNQLHQHLENNHFEGYFKCDWDKGQCRVVANTRQLVINHYLNAHQSNK